MPGGFAAKHRAGLIHRGFDEGVANPAARRAQADPDDITDLLDDSVCKSSDQI